MRLTVPVIVKDPEVSDWKDIPPTEPVDVQSEPFFLDGPVSPRVAVVDFDPETGVLRPGVRFRPPDKPGGTGAYELETPVQQGGLQVSPDAASVSVFGTVYKTIEMFEEPDALGRRVTWAFGAPQLLVVPRAGEWANAFYERDSHSLQFFFFPAGDGRVIYTSHSQDIVSHETTHAVLDGLAPDLYHAISPQALAIHEAVADVAALLCAFSSRELSRRVLETTGGSIERSTAFSGIAEQFAGALHRNRAYLRDLANDKSLDPKAPPGRRVNRSDPHELSEVLSGALYRTVVHVYNALREGFSAPVVTPARLIEADEPDFVQQKMMGAGAPRGDWLGLAMKALFVAGERLKRTLFRGLDYLPPGDATFADLARAILAADQASHPDSDSQRTYLRDAFVRRGIVRGSKSLSVKTDFAEPAVRKLDLDALIESDYVAYEFADANRALLRIPAGITFEVRPRLDVKKLYWHRDGKKEVRECLLKVAWTDLEPNPVGGGLPDRRRWMAGTTLAIDWETHRVRALLSTSRGGQERKDSTAILGRLLSDGVLQLDEAALGPEQQVLRGVVQGQVIDGALRMRGTGRMLHIVRAARL